MYVPSALDGLQEKTDLQCSTDQLGRKSLSEVSNFPMQPKNPFGTTQPGSQASEKLQAWIAGRRNLMRVMRMRFWYWLIMKYGPDQGRDLKVSRWSIFLWRI